MKRVTIIAILVSCLSGCSAPHVRYTATRQPDGGVILQVTPLRSHGVSDTQTVELIGPGIYGVKSGEKVVLYSWEIIRTKNVRWDRLGYAWMDGKRSRLHLDLSYYVSDPAKHYDNNPTMALKVIKKSELNGEYRITQYAEPTNAPYSAPAAGLKR